MNELQRESQRLQRGGIVIRDITTIQVRIPECCRNGGFIKTRGGVEEPCPHVVQRLKAKRGNIGL